MSYPEQKASHLNTLIDSLRSDIHRSPYDYYSSYQIIEIDRQVHKLIACYLGPSGRKIIEVFNINGDNYFDIYLSFNTGDLVEFSVRDTIDGTPFWGGRKL